MIYQGGKAWAAKDLLPIMLKDRKPGQMYVEPFVGGCNMIQYAPNPRMAGDVNPYLISLVEALQDGWEPPKAVPEDLYNRARSYFYAVRDGKPTDEKFDDATIGYIGINLSVKGRMFGGYKRDPNGGRDYGREAYNHVMAQAPRLKGIKFYNKQYYELPIPDDSIIYCDPPYQTTPQTGKKSVGYRQYSKDFDHDKFWNWCREMADKGHKVFVSEYTAPDDFEEIWSKFRGGAQEKLFVFKGIRESLSNLIHYDNFIV